MNYESSFGEVIHAYTRSQAIEDGVLKDVTETAKEAGLIWPTAVTQSVWNYMIDNEEESNENAINIKTYDVCAMLVWAIKIKKPTENEILYPITRIVNETQKDVLLKATLTPGDEGEPTFTISMPEED
ncbi:hypothetical protein MZM54_00625 [[Brevibacterium] frigoritolerans]|nr:hypothetical protein [Peribacillus frigoritolerans]